LKYPLLPLKGLCLHRGCSAGIFWLISSYFSLFPFIKY
jgi:hypothetical protein